MANRAYLIYSDSDEAPGPSMNGLNYDPDTEILAGASYAIPILWCSLFAEEDMKYHKVEGCRIPTLVAERDLASTRFRQRFPALGAAFPSYSRQIEEWDRLVCGLPLRYVKVDTTEIWLLDPDGFERRLLSSVRWYNAGAPEAMQSLASLSGATYDSENRLLVVTEEYEVDYCLHGYRWLREVPWGDP
jgi:hypothetical protein